MQTRISNFKKMMKTFEDNLYKKYDAMESALAGLGSQMNYLSSMMGNS
jgi:flagellar hook-associated protein 2